MDNQNDNNIYSEPVNNINPPPPIPPPPKPSKVFGIISMVLGIISLLCVGGVWSCGLFPIAGLILGIISRKKNEEPKALSLVGIITSVLGLIVAILFLVFGGIGIIMTMINS